MVGQPRVGGGADREVEQLLGGRGAVVQQGLGAGLAAEHHAGRGAGAGRDLVDQHLGADVERDQRHAELLEAGLQRGGDHAGLPRAPAQRARGGLRVPAGVGVADPVQHLVGHRVVDL
ncbi:MAG: hypothetical protein ACK559_30985, partial [bacterium]